MLSASAKHLLLARALRSSSFRTVTTLPSKRIDQHRTPVQLVLEDGTVFNGYSFGATGAISGEVVFNTGMSSYPESLTDPSYKGQILTMTYPLIGNYGVPGYDKDEFGLFKYMESGKIHVSGLVVSDYSHHYSHFEAVKSLDAWMKAEGIPGIYGVDTRAITKRIRNRGTLLGKIVPAGLASATDFADPNRRNLIAEVSRTKPQIYAPPGGGDIDILAIDCGMKESIIRHLVQRGARVKVVPWNYNIAGEHYDGLFYSNGPGDPTMAAETVEHLRHAMKGDIPIFGICMGHQIMAMAAGAKTYKLPFGNRGQNQPCINLEDKRYYITAQNHGYGVDASTLPAGWVPLFTNANDNSNEGCKHTTKPFFSVQFHPEACGGPEDTTFLFDRFLNHVRLAKVARSDWALPIGPALASGRPLQSMVQRVSTMSFPSSAIVGSYPPLKKVLILGSGGLSIGQAGEFDYSGSQAIKAVNDYGIETILMNPNIATVQTAEGLASKVYLLPVTAEFVQQVIERERPDGILLQFGGQTALNCGIELDRLGVLKHYGVRVLGTSVASIIATEDREIFANKLLEINEKIAQSIAATSTEDAVRAANDIGYPVIVRAAFSLGGLGSGFAHDDQQLRTLCGRAFSTCPQVLVEKSLKGWKEVEYEVVRDQFDNCVTVCNMENFDPLGIHTGDSIVVAPSQTLSDKDYHMLRSSAMRVARHLNIIGECNVQFALDPHSRDYVVIEVNPRLSRSSALASKATGYPLAHVAAKLAMGENLGEVRNAVTGNTTACFEPSLDYIVTKIPRWDIKKFNNASHVLGSGMKSVGEVMAIGRSFEESFQKAIRMVDPSNKGFEPRSCEDLQESLTVATEARPYAIAQAMREGYSVDEIHALTHIDRWFLHKLRRILDLAGEAARYKISNIPMDLMKDLKQAGFSDTQIGMHVGAHELEVRDARKKMGITPVFKQIDTLAAEFPARTNYLYASYNGTEHDVEFTKKAVMVLGSGVYRIGSSVEFDYSAVQCIRTLRKLGKSTIMVNYNPETVSTDFDESDRLYFEELSLERVLDICDLENPEGVVVSVGGQLPNNMALGLAKAGINVLGTHPDNIDRAEDRDKYSSLMDKIGVDQPEWKELSNIKEVEAFCAKVGFPVLVRPSYVLSGAAMNVVRNPLDLQRYLTEAAEVSREHPVVISKFIEGAREIELDAVAQKGKIVAHAISAHVEQAGVHSGDATLVLPARELEKAVYDGIYAAGEKIAKALEISGPFNSQFIVESSGAIKVIETNLRASRSLPFCSKVLGVNFVEKATEIFLDMPVKKVDVDLAALPQVGVKTAQFSWSRLLGADPVLGVEMASTGEVACFGPDVEEAFIKALLATNFRLPQKNILVMSGDNKDAFLPSARALAAMGYKLFATPGSAQHLSSNGVAVTRLSFPRQDDYLIDPTTPDVLHALRNKKVDLFITFPKVTSLGMDPDNAEQRKSYRIRRTAVDYNVPIITNLQVAQMLVRALAKTKFLSSESYQEIRGKCAGTVHDVDISGK